MASDFQSKNEAQFKRLKEGLQNLGRFYIIEIAEYAIERTPGFGRQYEKTDYIPTGRLRGGWNHVLKPIRTTSKGYDVKRHEDGPFSAYGRETIARITEQVFATKMRGISYLENDVAYGDDIVFGANNHNHIGPRNFPADAATQTAMHAAYRRAMARLGG